MNKFLDSGGTLPVAKILFIGGILGKYFASWMGEGLNVWPGGGVYLEGLTEG